MVSEATFCFIDLAGFSALTETHGDEAAAELIDRFTALVTAALGDDAHIVDAVGDAAFVVAESPERALRFVERLWRRAEGETGFPALRAGLHHGEAVERDGRYFGTAVNLAARVAAQARGDQVVATSTVADAARRSGRKVQALGTFNMRNLRDPVALHLVEFGAAGDTLGAIDPVCRMRVLPEQVAGRLRWGQEEYVFCSLDCAQEFARNPELFIAKQVR